MEDCVINASDPLRLFLTGPLLVFLLTGCFAVLTLAALAAGRLTGLAQQGIRAAARLESGRAIPTLWGLTAGLLIFLTASILFKSHTFALLGILVLAVGLALTGLGLAAASLAVGKKVSEALDLLETDPLAALRLGLWTIGLASAVPFAGWLFTLLYLASGIGAVLEVLTVRPRPAQP